MEYVRKKKKGKELDRFQVKWQFWIIQSVEKLLKGEKFKKFNLFRISKRWQRYVLITIDKCSLDERIYDKNLRDKKYAGA